MISKPKNRVQAIKSKFENLNNENLPSFSRKIPDEQLCKQDFSDIVRFNEACSFVPCNSKLALKDKNGTQSDVSSDECPKPNPSYLYGKIDIEPSFSDTKSFLSRQTSDPGKKLQRRDAFRCDRSQKINHSPKRHDSCNGRSETSDFVLNKMSERKLSKDRLKKLGDFIEDHMRKESLVPTTSEKVVGLVREIYPQDSIPDENVPKHILDQYAKVNKTKKKEEKQDAMTDSGVSSETENVEDDQSGRIKKLVSQFEKPDILPKQAETNTPLNTIDDLGASTETIKLERKNPNVVLTDTLKKALKQPLPTGPPPKKPPRILPAAQTFENGDKEKTDTKRKLEKLEKVLLKREAQNHSKNIYDIAEENLSVKKPKEIHYLCTEILDITQRTLLPNQNLSNSISECFNSLNCAVRNNSVSSLPYSRLSSGFDSNRNSVKICCSCSNNSLDKDKKSQLRTFLEESKCLKCQINDQNGHGFKYHLNCKCKMERSEFFIQKENIYDEPDTGVDSVSDNDKNSKYGTLINCKLNAQSKSLEDLRCTRSEDQQNIYAVPFTNQRPTTPDFATIIPKSEFKKLRENFENGFRNSKGDEKPTLANASKSSEEVCDDFKYKKKLVEKKFATEVKRYRNKCVVNSNIGVTLAKRKNSQLDADRENLKSLMNEIYEVVTEAYNMEEKKPGSFPTEHSDSTTSEDSVKVSRSLTEKRKNYVRRVSSRVAYLEPKHIKNTRHRYQTSVCSYKPDIDRTYSTFRSWKSFRTSQSNVDKMERSDSTDSKINLTDSKGNLLSMKNEFSSDATIDKLSIDEKAGCVDIDLPFEPRERGLFNVCLLVGLNYMTGQAYVKSVFPEQVQVPPHIENLIFPETLSSASKGEWCADARGAQCYSMVLTDERGERAYGYCRRVLPEGATTCLPICYCLIGRYRAPGFYYKVLQEIESHHGSSEIEISSILHQLFESDFPNPGEEITVEYTTKKIEASEHTNSTIDSSVLNKSKTMPDMRRSDGEVEKMEKLPDFYDLENNNSHKRVVLNFDGPRVKTIKRPLEPRVEEDNLSTLLDLFGTGLVIKVFSSLLLERKVVIIGDNLRSVSSCMEALQSSLYPFVWQQPLISAIPSEIQRDVLEAPLPILAGMLKTNEDGDNSGIMFEEGMLIDLTHPSKAIFYQGDESTILPTSSYKALKTSLQMESIKHKDRQEDVKARNVMISEAFMTFFVHILGDFWSYFSEGVLKDGDLGKDKTVFDRDAFIKNTPSKQNQYFLDWFTETAMFNHFIQNMAAIHQSPSPTLVDTPLPNFYQLFEERVRSKSNRSTMNVEGKNYKSAVNKRVKLLKNKLRDLVA